jgi:hypothetical protein
MPQSVTHVGSRPGQVKLAGHSIGFPRCGAAFRIEQLAFAFGCTVDFVRS